MQKLVHKRLRYAWLLILVYLPILLAVSFHHHDDKAEANVIVYCYDCAHHIHHDGHFIGDQSMHSCVLCMLQNMTYIAPTIVTLATFVAIMCIAHATTCPFVNKLHSIVLSTRAPPTLCF